MKKPGYAIWKEIAANIKRKPATVLYPAQRLPIPPNFRGRPTFRPEKCIGCMLCVRDCPSEAVKIEKTAPKTFTCTFYLDRCIFCGQCADSCNKEAIVMTQEYELTSLDRPSLVKVTKGTPPPPAPETPEKPEPEKK